MFAYLAHIFALCTLHFAVCTKVRTPSCDNIMIVVALFTRNKLFSLSSERWVCDFHTPVAKLTSLHRKTSDARKQQPKTMHPFEGNAPPSTRSTVTVNKPGRRGHRLVARDNIILIYHHTIIISYQYLFLLLFFFCNVERHTIQVIIVST